MNSPDLELLPLWRRCVEHALVNYGDTMPAELRLWFAEQLMHDGPPITSGCEHCVSLDRMTDVASGALCVLTPTHSGDLYVKGLNYYAARHQIS